MPFGGEQSFTKDTLSILDRLGYKNIVLTAISQNIIKNKSQVCLKRRMAANNAYAIDPWKEYYIACKTKFSKLNMK